MLLATATLALQPSSTWACAVCFGKSSDSLAKGMNMGFLALLAGVLIMWVAFGAFFIFLARPAYAAATKSEISQPANPDPIR